MDEQISSTGEAQRSSWGAQFLGPIRYCFRPSHCGPIAARMATSAWLCNFLLAAVLAFVLISALVAWNDRVRIYTMDGRTMVETRTWSDLLREAWGADAAYELIEQFFAVGMVIIALVSLATWVFLIDLYRRGRVAPVILCGARIATAAGWPAMLLAAGFGAAINLADHHDRYERAVGVSRRLHVADLVMFWIFPTACLLLIAWLGRAMRSASRGHVEPAAPLCEFCGYDLTHLPASRTCSECGTSVERSLGESAARRGIAWETRPGLRSGMAAWASVLFRPSMFFRQLRLRNGSSAAIRFARLNYLTMGIVASVWIATLVLIGSPPAASGEVPLEVALGLGFLLWVPLVGLMLHRLILALMATGWILRGSLRDAVWGLKAAYYESAFLWGFSAWTALSMTVQILFFNEVRAIQEWTFGRRMFILGVPIEVFTMLSMEALLCLIWVWRYRQIYLAIRWNNA